MSKSDTSDQTRINLNDSADAIAQKIRRARTDPEPLPSEPAGLEGRPEARNLVGLYAALANTNEAGVLAAQGGKGFSTFKEDLAGLLVATIGPIATETGRLLADPTHIESVLRRGAERARGIAGPIVAEAKRLVGFLRV